MDFQGSAGEEYLKETSRPEVKEIVPRLNVTPPKAGIEAIMRTAMENNKSLNQSSCLSVQS